MLLSILETCKWFIIKTELRQSRTSLAAASERMSRASYAGSFHGGPQSMVSSTRRARPRSRSRDQLNTAHLYSNRPASRWIKLRSFLKHFSETFITLLRFSTSGSTHNLSNCYDTSDNWTDNDMEIYMARNATTRTGLCQLWGLLFVSWYIEVLLELDKVFWHLNEYDRQHGQTPIVAHDNLLFFVSLGKTSDRLITKHLSFK